MTSRERTKLTKKLPVVEEFWAGYSIWILKDLLNFSLFSLPLLVFFRALLVVPSNDTMTHLQAGSSNASCYTYLANPIICNAMQCKQFLISKPSPSKSHCHDNFMYPPQTIITVFSAS